VLSCINELLDKEIEDLESYFKIHKNFEWNDQIIERYNLLLNFRDLSFEEKEKIYKESYCPYEDLESYDFLFKISNKLSSSSYHRENPQMISADYLFTMVKFYQEVQKNVEEIMKEKKELKKE